MYDSCILTNLRAFTTNSCVGRKECHSPRLWKQQCFRTGKCRDDTFGGENFRELYYRRPCVPVDFPTLADALSHVTHGETIVLMPQLHFVTEPLVLFQSVTIRASFGSACLAAVDLDQENQPCLRVHHVEGHGKVHVCLQDISILHATKGNNIWQGNCAIHVQSPHVSFALQDCSIQSDTGRGMVVGRGAHAKLCQVVLHDCAATGLYVGERASVQMDQCHVVRNGHGFSGDQNDGPVVPPGHSGVYVEAGMAVVQDSSLQNNSLTGVSVVRGGWMRLSGNWLAQNGAGGYLVDDPLLLGEERGGGLVEGPKPNVISERSATTTTPHRRLLQGGPLTLASLRQRYQSVSSSFTF